MSHINDLIQMLDFSYTVLYIDDQQQNGNKNGYPDDRELAWEMYEKQQIQTDEQK